MKYCLPARKARLTGVMAFAACTALAQQRPNVIFIMADDIGYGDLECYNGKETTPHVNEFARQGCLFTDAYAVASTSTPSRYSFLTGKYSWREANTGIATGDAGMIISPETFTVADLFSKAGYCTAAFGKWHLGLGSTTGAQSWNTELDQGLTELGFDDWHIMAATADRVPCVYIRGNSEKGGRKVNHGRVVNLDPKDPIRVSYTQAIGDSTWFQFPDAVKLAPRAQNDHHGATIVDSIPRIGHMTGGYAARWKDENIADTIVANTIGFMREKAAAGEPFFIYMATNDIHVPRWPHKRFRGKSKMGLRGEAIMAFDWSVGQIMDALKALNIDDNTLVIISSDNGPVLDDGYADRAEPLAQAAGHLISGGLRGGKYTAYEGGTRVPFLVRWPGHVPQGTLSKALVSQVDFLGTMAELLGEDIPAGQGMDSRKEASAWLGKDLENGRDYVLETTNNRKVSVRTHEWKYVHTGELYKMNETELHDEYTPLYTPTEATNVAANCPEQVIEMKNIITEEAAKAEVLDAAKELLDATKPSDITVSELTRVDSLTTADGLPGTQTGTQFRFSSKLMTLDEHTNIIRLTFTSTNTHPKGQQNGNKAYCPVGLAELGIVNESGDTLKLESSNFFTNNQEQTEGPITGICDGDVSTYWHSTWSQATTDKPYLEIRLSQTVSGFKFYFVSKHAANVPQSILISSVKQHTESVPGLQLPQSYVDTLQSAYALYAAHLGDTQQATTLNTVVSNIKTFLSYRERIASGDFLVDNAQATNDLAYLTTEEMDFIRTTVDEAKDYAADCERFKHIESFFLPETDSYYALYNKKTKMYAGMQTAENSSRRDAITDNDTYYFWIFKGDDQNGKYWLYNTGLQQPVSRKDSRESVFAKNLDAADRWILVPRDGGYFNIKIASSEIVSDRDCLNDNGQTVNAYSDDDDPSTFWQIRKKGEVVSGITPVNQNGKMPPTSVYNLKGQRVTDTSRGIYIVNGEKVFSTN